MVKLSKLRRSIMVLCIAFILCFCCPSGNSAHAVSDSVSLSYWYATGETDIWYSSVPIYARCYDNELGFYVNLYPALMSGVNRWNSAGFLPFSISRVTVDENVRFYGGTSSYLKSAFPAITDNTEGYAPIVEPSSSTAASYSGATKTIYEFDGTNIRKVAIIDKGSTSAQYQIVGAHEMGHVLGWYGHTSDPTQLMYGQATATAVMTKDILHIKQVYDALY